LLALVAFTCAAPVGAEEIFNGRPLRLDEEGKLLSWFEPQSSAYDRAALLPWDFLKNRVPVCPNGLKTYFGYSMFDPVTLQGHALVSSHTPAGLYAMLVQAAIAEYAYSGDRQVIELVSELTNYELAHGLTPDGWEWPRVPYATAQPGALEYGGYDNDHVGGLEADKVGEAGFGFLRLFEVTGEPGYRAAALDCANALAAHVRVGDESHSPWPFRVDAKTGAPIEEYTANVLGAIKLFDELIRLELGDVAGYRHARDLAWTWLFEFPMKNNYWQAYFEDVYPTPNPGQNATQYIAMETARYLLQHPELDPDWRAHAGGLIEWSRARYGVDTAKEKGLQWGAEVMSEQDLDMNKMGSHTSRYASLKALWYEKTGDEVAKQQAFRSFNWASYMCDANGLVSVGVDGNDFWWFSDGYGDYTPHFLAGMASVPEWAPLGEAHLLKSTSVATEVTISSTEVAYSTFDASGSEVLRLPFRPAQVSAGNQQLSLRKDLNAQGYTVEALPSGDFVVRVRRAAASRVRLSAVGGGCSCTQTNGAAGVLSALVVLVVRTNRRRRPLSRI
jgi:uncharacterized protein (TIGR03382 family)